MSVAPTPQTGDRFLAGGLARSAPGIPFLCCAGVLENAAAAGTSIALTGCVSVQKSYDGHDASRVDPFVELNKTTVAQMREYLGTPATLAQDKDGNQVVVFALVGNRDGGAFARNLGKSMLTFGFGASITEYTQKNIIFKATPEGVITDMKKNGWAYLLKHRALFWNECERPLNEQEMDTPLNYTVKEIQQTYAEWAAAQRGIPVEDVDLGKETDFCNMSCMANRDAIKAFGPLVAIDGTVDALEGDGSKFDLVVPPKAK